MPFLFFAGLTALSQLDAPRMLGIGASLGYRPGIAWLKLIAPRLYALIRLPVYAALAYALSAVDMALVLGPTTPPPLAVLAVDLTHDPDLARRFPAAALALLHLLLTLAALGAWRLLELLVARALRPILADGKRSPAPLWSWGAALGRALALARHRARRVGRPLPADLVPGIDLAVPRCHARLLHARRHGNAPCRTCGCRSGTA